MMILIGGCGTSLNTEHSRTTRILVALAHDVIYSRKTVCREAFFKRNRWRDKRQKGTEKNREDINKMRRGNELARDKKIRRKNEMREK